LVAPCYSGDVLLSQDGRNFFRADGPAGAGDVTTWNGALFIAHSVPTTRFPSVLGALRSVSIAVPTMIAKII